MERKNELGTIKLNDAIFQKIVEDAIGMFEKKAYPAASRNKIEIREDEDHYVIFFDIIVRFGVSISYITTQILDEIERELRELAPDKKIVVDLRVSGVKSHRIAERDILFERIISE